MSKRAEGIASRVIALADKWAQELREVKGQPPWDRRTTGGRRCAVVQRCLGELCEAIARATGGSDGKA